MPSKQQLFKWVFTINSSEHSPSMQQIYNLLSDAFKRDEGVKDATFQIEVGTVTERPHIQGRIHYVKKRTKSSVLQYFKTIYLTTFSDASDTLYKNTTISPEQDAQASIAYCSKSETRYPGTDTFHKLYKVPAYTGRDVSFIGNNLRPWQRFVMKLLDDKPYDTRKIYWFVDHIGASGKSCFAKYLLFNFPTSVGIIDDSGTSAQLKATAYNIGPREVYLVDLPRVRPSTMDDIMRCLEVIKGGRLSTTLYGGAAPILFDPPLMLVFSNSYPKTEDMSRDRWQIYKINKSYDLEFIPVLE